MAAIDIPEDGSPVRSFDLSTLYHGDEFGRAMIRGPVTSLNLPLYVITVWDKSRGPVNLVVYEGTPVLRKGGIVPMENLRIGEIVEVTVTGGRASMLILLDVEL